MNHNCNEDLITTTDTELKITYVSCSPSDRENFYQVQDKKYLRDLDGNKIVVPAKKVYQNSHFGGVACSICVYKSFK